jgi:hypothetical protein
LLSNGSLLYYATFMPISLYRLCLQDLPSTYSTKPHLQQWIWPASAIHFRTPFYLKPHPLKNPTACSLLVDIHSGRAEPLDNML